MTDPMTPECLAEIEQRFASGRVVNVVTQRELLAEVRRLQAAVERVRALHAAIPYAVSDRFREAHPWVPRLVCAACGEDEAVEWPCPTIAALDGDT